MASKLSNFLPVPPLRSHLVKNTPDAVPSIEELEFLQSELKNVREKTLQRARKADEDLRTIEETMRRMTEREKGKAKSIDRIKRERDFTPIPDADNSRQSSVLHGHHSKTRVGSHSAAPVPASSARSSVDPRRLTAEELKKKKKKRPREGGDSDIEREPQRPRKATPPALHATNHAPPAKPQKPAASAPVLYTKVGSTSSGPDFSPPSPTSLLTSHLLPARPPIPPPPIPGPSKPIEVTEDFSKTKVPQQTAISTFYTSIEPWIRPIKEEDVGFLEYNGDEVEPFIMPKLGRHYLEVWEDQDAGLIPVLGEPQIAPRSHFAAPTPKWDPSTLSDGDLIVEEKGHGPLTERVISALLPNPDLAVWKGVKAAEDAMEGRPGGSGAAAARRERLNVNDLELRIRDMMRAHGLIDGMPDFAEKVDDPIASALREAQAELRKVLSVNKARKARLVAIARDRLGHQEYLECRDSIDKNITTLYTKLQKKDAPKANKKKKKPLQGAAAISAAAALNGNLDEGPQPLPPCPAALGLSPDEENHLMVHDQLKHLIETRRQWVDTVGSVFDQKEAENPGRIHQLPKESVYKGIEEEVEVIMAGLDASNPPANGANSHGIVPASRNSNGAGNSKGKGRASDAMDIG